MPQVTVRFSDPAPSAQTSQAPAPPAVTAGGRRPPVANELTERAAELLDASDALMARVYALRRLAQRFPPEREGQLGSDERLALARLRREHAAALSARAEEMQRLLAAALPTPAAGPAPARPPALPERWQPAAEELFAIARRFEILLASAVGGTPAEIPANELPGRLFADASHLRGIAEAYEHIGR
jgi:hypothetical protein